MITEQEWHRLEILLDTKLEQKLEQKLDEKLNVRFAAFEEKMDKKLDAKLDAKFGEFAILMKNAFDEVHYKIDSCLERLDNHDWRISRVEHGLVDVKKVIRI